MAQRGGFWVAYQCSSCRCARNEPRSQKPLPVDDVAVKECAITGGTQKGTQAMDIDCPILAKVVEKWETLSEDTKRAIGVIVDI